MKEVSRGCRLGRMMKRTKNLGELPPLYITPQFSHVAMRQEVPQLMSANINRLGTGGAELSWPLQILKMEPTFVLV